MPSAGLFWRPRKLKIHVHIGEVGGFPFAAFIQPCASLRSLILGASWKTFGRCSGRLGNPCNVSTVSGAKKVPRKKPRVSMSQKNLIVESGDVEQAYPERGERKTQQIEGGEQASVGQFTYLVHHRGQRRRE